MAGSARALWAGITWAPLGDIRWDGLRVRTQTAAGDYRYATTRWNGSRVIGVDFTGQHRSTEMLLGWQQRIGGLTVKAFAGGTHQSHLITPLDAENEVQGGRLGAKAALETWLALGDRSFLQADASWSQPFDAWSLRTKAGYRVLPMLALGGEAAYGSTMGHGTARLGTFSRLEWSRGELSVAAGLAREGEGANSGYATLGIVFRY